MNEIQNILNEEAAEYSAQDLRTWIFNDDFPSYIAMLKLTYDISLHSLRRNYKELRGEYEHAATSNLESNALALEAKTYLDLLDQGFNVLSNDEARKSYLKAIEIRCILSQVFTMEDIVKKNTSRLFPYMIFPLQKKQRFGSTGVYLRIDFVDQIVEERKNGRIVAAYHFTIVEGAVAGVMVEDLTVTYRQSSKKTQEATRYKCLLTYQRDMLLDILNLIPELAKREAKCTTASVIINPNIENPEATVKHIVGNMIRGMGSQKDKIRVVVDDRIMPPRGFCQLLAAKKGSLFSTGTKVYLTLGRSYLVVSRDEEMQQVFEYYPLVKDYFSYHLARETASVAVGFGNDKSIFRFKREAEALNFYFLLKLILKSDLEYTNAINDKIPHFIPNSFTVKQRNKEKKRVQKRMAALEKELEQLRGKKIHLEEQIDAEKGVMKSRGQSAAAGELRVKRGGGGIPSDTSYKRGGSENFDRQLEKFTGAFSDYARKTVDEKNVDIEVKPIGSNSTMIEMKDRV